MKRSIAMALGSVLFAIACIAPAQSQSDFPSRPITIIVPFPPGGSSDTVTRLVAQKLGANLKTNVVIDNRGGGGGVPAALAMKQIAPDGYTVFLANNGLFAIMPALTDVRFDPVKDFQPITPLCTFPSVLVVPDGSPARSAKDLVELAKSKPGGLNFTSQGVGSGGHVLGEMLRLISGAPFTHVPYRGAGPQSPTWLPATSISCSAHTCQRSGRSRLASSACSAGPRPSARRRSPTCPPWPRLAIPGLSLWSGTASSHRLGHRLHS